MTARESYRAQHIRYIRSRRSTHTRETIKQLKFLSRPLCCNRRRWMAAHGGIVCARLDKFIVKHNTSWGRKMSEKTLPASFEFFALWELYTRPQQLWRLTTSVDLQWRRKKSLLTYILFIFLHTAKFCVFFLFFALPKTIPSKGERVVEIK